jgi:hypothetical protein
MATPAPRWEPQQPSKPATCKPKPVIGTIAIQPGTFANDCLPPDTAHFKFHVVLHLTGSVPATVAVDFVPLGMPTQHQPPVSNVAYEICLPPTTPLHWTITVYNPGGEIYGHADCDFGAG